MKGIPIRYLPEELAWIEARKDWPRKQLHTAFAFQFGRHDVSQGALTALCKRRGWTTGQSGRFEKGHKTHNKGKAMPWNPNSAATRFAKGHLPHNAHGPGHESIDSKDGYVWLIVAERNPYTGAKTRRVQKHRWLWEKANGPVPAGHALKCLDGDKTNCAPENWVAIPRAMMPRLNGRFGRGFEDAPTELKPIILATTKLEHAAREAKRRKAP